MGTNSFARFGRYIGSRGGRCCRCMVNRHNRSGCIVNGYRWYYFHNYNQPNTCSVFGRVFSSHYIRS